MKVLLDECVPRKFKDSLSGHDCSTVPDEGLAGKKNGELLALAESAGFQVFLTLDRGIEYQQNLHPRTIAVVIIRTKSSQLAELLWHVPDLLQALKSIEPGQLIRMTLIK
jgi:predicted nuclease of predicted toxin-antitoxin system